MTRRVVMAALVAAALAPGCGAGKQHHAKRAAPSEAEREVQERADAARRIPAVDRIAYYQIATTSGLLRGAAAVALEGRGRAPGAATLRAAGTRLGKLRPRDRNLGLAGRRLRSALRDLRAAPRSGAGRLRGARAALRATDAVNARLRVYVKATPAAAALTPD